MREDRDVPLTLRDIMTREVQAITPEATIREAALFLADHAISGAPVVANGRLVGVVSASDIVEFNAVTPGVPEEAPVDIGWEDVGETAIAAEGDEVSGTFFVDLWADEGADVHERFEHVDGPEWDVLSEHTVEEVMTRRLCTLPPDTTLAAAARTMLGERVHRVLIVEDGRLLGLVSTTDFLRAIAEDRLCDRASHTGREDWSADRVLGEPLARP